MIDQTAEQVSVCSFVFLGDLRVCVVVVAGEVQRRRTRRRRTKTVRLTENEQEETPAAPLKSL